MQELAYRIGVLLSSYSQAINRQNDTTGSLFQQKTKSKNLSTTENYLITCMHYIHQNAWHAGLVNKIEDWPYSSFLDYAGLRQVTLCNKSLLMELTVMICKIFIEIVIMLLIQTLKEIFFEPVGNN